MYRLLILSLAIAGLACGCDKSARSTTSTYINIEVNEPEGGWATKVRYQTETGEYPKLFLNDVEFDLRDASVYKVDFDALGIRGLTNKNTVNYKSTGPVAQPEFLFVLDKVVEIKDGNLLWGDETVGAVQAGDTVIVDAKGLTIKK